MRTLKLTLFLLFLYAGFSSATTASMTLIDGKGIFRKSGISSDTSEINRLTHLALSSKPDKKNQVQYMKAYIDSAELLCKKANIEIPAMLHLARAEYFLLISDFSNAYQEATIAQKLADNEGESAFLARTMYFLGRYSQQTGSFDAGINYYTKTIEIAKKKKIKGFIPASYWGISVVYKALGNQEEYRNTLQLLIDAAIEENDTLNIKSGYFRLGSFFTEDSTSINRDFNSADSILRECLKLSLITSDTNFVALSLANLGWNYYLNKNYKTSLEHYNRSLS